MDGGRPKHQLCAFWGARTRENMITNRVRSMPRASQEAPLVLVELDRAGNGVTARTRAYCRGCTFVLLGPSHKPQTVGKRRFGRCPHAISEVWWTSRKRKCHSGSRLNQRDRATRGLITTKPTASQPQFSTLGAFPTHHRFGRPRSCLHEGTVAPTCVLRASEPHHQG